MNNITLTLGGPGCGKTSRLLSHVEQELHAGTPPNRIAYVAFTKEAAAVARQRAAEQFGLDPEKDLPWFRTIHSLAYQRLGITREEVMGPRDYDQFAELVGEPMRAPTEEEMMEGVPGSAGPKGARLLRIVDFAATTGRALEEVWQTAEEFVTWHEVKRFDAAYTGYKEQTGKMDFTDMLLQYAVNGDPVPVDVAVIDEAQDLTHAQYFVARRAFSGVRKCYIGGDDDQSIYTWAGADLDSFLHLPVVQTDHLQYSHRLPRSVFQAADRILLKIRNRYKKSYAPDTREGLVEFHQTPDAVPLSEDGTWLLLARNTFLLVRLIGMAREMGVNYTTRHGPAVDPRDVMAIVLYERLRSGKRTDLEAGEVRLLLKKMERAVPQLRETKRYTPADLELPLSLTWYWALTGISASRRDYYLSLLRRGEKLSAPPRYRIDTIHGVKGAEADHVMLLTDVSSRTLNAARQDPDAEHRVFYVGATRARQSLHVVMPQTTTFYDFPH